jgi:hypothetical protein
LHFGFFLQSAIAASASIAEAEKVGRDRAMSVSKMRKSAFMVGLVSKFLLLSCDGRVQNAAKIIFSGCDFDGHVASAIARHVALHETVVTFAITIVVVTGIPISIAPKGAAYGIAGGLQLRGAHFG